MIENFVDNELEKIATHFMPLNKILLSDISHQVKESNLIRKYLISNFESDRDSWKIGGKIHPGKEVALCIRRRYAK